MRSIDAVNYLPHVAPGSILLQFGKEDTRPSPADGREAVDAASEPKRAERYAAGHDLDDQAHQDRAQWLAERLDAD